MTSVLNTYRLAIPQSMSRVNISKGDTSITKPRAKVRGIF
jgi:hypothetical protein